MSSLQQNWRRGQNRFCLEARRMGMRGRGLGKYIFKKKKKKEIVDFMSIIKMI
jgi:hypothetical protein